MSSKSPVREKENKTGLIQHVTLVVGLVCVGIGQTLLYTILGPASREIGISEFSVGLIVTTAALIITLSSGLWGGLIARFGSKHCYVTGMACYTAGTLALGYALEISTQHLVSTATAFASLLIIRGITGALTAGIHPAAMTYVAESTAKDNRGTGIALIASAYGIGSVTGPLLGTLSGSYSLLLPLYMAAALSLTATILGVFSLNPQKCRVCSEQVANLSIKLTDKRVLPLFIGIACTYVGFSTFQQTISFFIQDVFSLEPQQAVRNTGVAVSFMALMMVITQLVYIQLIKPGTKILLYSGLIFSIAGFVLLIIMNKSLITTYIASGCIGTGFGMMIPSIQTLASLAVDEKEQSGVAGFLFAASAFGYVTGPALGTFLYSINSDVVFLFCIISLIIAALFTRIIIISMPRKCSTPNQK